MYRSHYRTRHCSFCGGAKHNKRTCEQRKSQLDDFYKDRAKYRAEILKKMREAGLGVGCLVKYEKMVLEIKKVLWDNIGQFPYYTTLHAVELGYDVVDSNILHLDLPSNYFDENQKSEITVVSPASAESIGHHLSDEWHEGIQGFIPIYLR